MSTDEQVEAVRHDANAQRRAALVRANEFRKRDSLVKRLLRERKLDPFELIEGNVSDVELAARLEAIIERWPVERLLLAVPGIGKAKMQSILVVFRASPKTKVRALKMERRKELAKLCRAARDTLVERDGTNRSRPA